MRQDSVTQLSEIIGCDVTENKDVMLAKAKEKLRWYTMEASEEEFDVETVDFLVEWIREFENAVEESPEEEAQRVEQQLLDKSSKIRRYPAFSRWAIGACAGVLLAVVVFGNFLMDTNAWEKQGFFQWLNRDKEGHTMITSPDDLETESGEVMHYYSLEEVPEEYRQYLVDPSMSEVLQGHELMRITVQDLSLLRRVSEIFVTEEKKSVELGVVIYETRVTVVREKYDDLEFQYSRSIEMCEQDIFKKEKYKRTRRICNFLLLRE